MKRLLLVLFLLSILVGNVFALSGTYTTNDFFYMPGYASYGSDEFDEYNAYMEIADNAIKANETASGDENIQDVAGAMFSSNTETGLTVTYQDADGTIDVVIGANDIVESMLKVVNTPNDEEIFTYESTTGDFEWHTLAELSIQPLDAGLTSIAGLTTAANDMIYTTALDTYAIMDTFAELQAVVADKTLINEEDAITLDSKLTLAVSGDDAMSISMTGITGTDNQAIDIIGGEALGAEEHWTAIRIKPDDLDPSAADTRIRGLAINLSGVDTTNVPDNLCGIRIKMPSGLSGLARNNTEAIYISEGDIEHIFTVPNTATSHFTAYDMVLDATLLVSTSAIHAFDFTVAGGDPSGDVCAVVTHTYVMPICQLIGSYSTPSQTEYAGEKTGGGASWVDGIDLSEIFVANSDEIYVGSTSQFSEIEVIFGTAATKTVGPTFWYNTAADAWTQFYPSDATNGFQNGGLISWDLASITAAWTNDGDPGGDSASSGYWIKIIRTSAPDPGTPTPTTVKIGTVTEYSWDESGDLTVHDIDANDIDAASLILDTPLSAAEGGTGVANNAASTITISGNYATTFTVTGTTGITLPTSGTLMANLSEDSTPQLGGNLDVNGNSIISASNNDITIQPNGTGNTIIYAPSDVVTTFTGTDTLTIAEAGTVLVSAGSDYTLTLPTAVGHTGLRYHFIKTDANYNLITLDANSTETFNYESATSAPVLTYAQLNTYCAEVTIVSDGSNWQVIDEALGQMPTCSLYMTRLMTIPTGVTTKVAFDIEVFDTGNNFDISTWVSGNADGTVADHLQDDTTSPFTSAMVGSLVKNTTDTTYAIITAFNDAGDVTISSDIFIDTEGYEIKQSKFVCPVSGTYRVETITTWAGAGNTVVALKQYSSRIYSNGASICSVDIHSGLATWLTLVVPIERPLIKDTIIDFWVRNNSGSSVDLYHGINSTQIRITLISKY